MVTATAIRRSQSHMTGGCHGREYATWACLSALNTPPSRQWSPAIRTARRLLSSVRPRHRPALSATTPRGPVSGIPTDPVQRGTVFGGGFTVDPPLTRNLLDFMDADVDKFGRVIVGFADGCISAGCVTGANKTDSKAELATIARQVNGKRLFAQSWDAPDDHGSPITGYIVFRNSDGGAFTEIASLDATARSFTDSAPPSNPTYKVTATNAVGESPACRAVSPTGGGGVVENPCDSRGLTIATDVEGDESALGSSNQDIQSLRVAGLFVEGTPSLNFTMKVSDLNSLPVNGSWRTHWTAPDGSRFFVSMNTFVAADNPTGEARPPVARSSPTRVRPTAAASTPTGRSTSALPPARSAIHKLVKL